MDFPQYRKMKGVNNFYKILNNREFIEIRMLGNKPSKSHFKAEQYPDILRIQEMLKMPNEWFEIISEKEFGDLDMVRPYP